MGLRRDATTNSSAASVVASSAAPPPGGASKARAGSWSSGSRASDAWQRAQNQAQAQAKPSQASKEHGSAALILRDAAAAKGRSGGDTYGSRQQQRTTAQQIVTRDGAGQRRSVSDGSQALVGKPTATADGRHLFGGHAQQAGATGVAAGSYHDRSDPSAAPAAFSTGTSGLSVGLPANQTHRPQPPPAPPPPPQVLTSYVAGSAARSSSGGGVAPAGAALEPGHPLPPPPPQPAQPAQARPSRSPSSSPTQSHRSHSEGGTDIIMLSMPVPLPMPMGPSASFAPAQLPASVATGPHHQSLSPLLTAQPPPRSQAAEELSAILSKMDSVHTAPPPPQAAASAAFSHGLGLGHARMAAFGHGSGAFDGEPEPVLSVYTVHSTGPCIEGAEAAAQGSEDGGEAGGGETGGIGSAGGGVSQPCDSEAALAQALAVARASALAAFLNPGARSYRPRGGFKTTRSDSSSPVANTAAAQVFAGVPATAAPFMAAGGALCGSPRCSGGSGGDSARSNSRSPTRSSHYEKLLLLQAAGTGPDGKGRGAAGGGPGADFLRRNEALLRKRQAWAKRKGAKESEGSPGSPRDQVQARLHRASWSLDADADSFTGRRRTSASLQQRSLMDLQRWADRRERRLATLREERQAEEQARTAAQLTFKPAIGERSRRLAKVARSRPSYMPLPKATTSPMAPSPPTAATTTSAAVAASTTGFGPSAAASSALLRRSGEGYSSAAGRPQSTKRGRAYAAQDGPGGGGSAGGASASTAAGTAPPGLFASVDQAELLRAVRGERPWHHPAPSSDGKGAATAGGGGEAAGASAAAAGPDSGGRSRPQSGAAQLAAARGTRVRGRYASAGGGYEDPVVGAVAEAINEAAAVLQLRPAGLRTPPPPQRPAAAPAGASAPRQGTSPGPASSPRPPQSGSSRDHHANQNSAAVDRSSSPSLLRLQRHQQQLAGRVWGAAASPASGSSRRADAGAAQPVPAAVAASPLAAGASGGRVARRTVDVLEGAGLLAGGVGGGGSAAAVGGGVPGGPGRGSVLMGSVNAVSGGGSGGRDAADLSGRGGGGGGGGGFLATLSASAANDGGSPFAAAKHPRVTSSPVAGHPAGGSSPLDAATTTLLSAGLTVRIPQAGRPPVVTEGQDPRVASAAGLGSPVAAALSGGDGGLVLGPTAPGGLAIGAFRYDSLSSSPAASSPYMGLRYDPSVAAAAGPLSPTVDTTSVPSSYAVDAVVGRRTTATAGVSRTVPQVGLPQAQPNDTAAVAPHGAAHAEFGLVALPAAAGRVGPQRTPASAPAPAAFSLAAATALTLAPSEPAAATAALPRPSAALLLAANRSSSGGGAPAEDSQLYGNTAIRTGGLPGRSSAGGAPLPPHPSVGALADARWATTAAAATGAAAAPPSPPLTAAPPAAFAPAVSLSTAMPPTGGAALPAPASPRATAHTTASRPSAPEAQAQPRAQQQQQPDLSYNSLVRGMRFTKMLAQQFAHMSLAASASGSGSHAAHSHSRPSALSSRAAAAKAGGAGGRVALSAPASREPSFTGARAIAREGRNASAGGAPSVPDSYTIAGAESLRAVSQARSVSAPSGPGPMGDGTGPGWLQPALRGGGAAAAGGAGVAWGEGERPRPTSQGSRGKTVSFLLEPEGVRQQQEQQMQPEGVRQQQQMLLRGSEEVVAFVGLAGLPAAAAIPGLAAPAAAVPTSAAKGPEATAISALLSATITTTAAAGVPKAQGDGHVPPQAKGPGHQQQQQQPANGDDDPLQALQALIWRVAHLGEELARATPRPNKVLDGVEAAAESRAEIFAEAHVEAAAESRAEALVEAALEAHPLTLVVGAGQAADRLVLSGASSSDSNTSSSSGSDESESDSSSDSDSSSASDESADGDGAIGAPLGLSDLAAARQHDAAAGPGVGRRNSSVAGDAIDGTAAGRDGVLYDACDTAAAAGDTAAAAAGAALAETGRSGVLVAAGPPTADAEECFWVESSEEEEDEGGSSGGSSCLALDTSDAASDADGPCTPPEPLGAGAGGAGGDGAGEAFRARDLGHLTSAPQEGVQDSVAAAAVTDAALGTSDSASSCPGSSHGSPSSSAAAATAVADAATGAVTVMATELNAQEAPPPSSSEAGAAPGGVSAVGQLPLEVLVKRAEQLRAAAMSAAGLDFAAASPPPAAASTPTGQHRQHPGGHSSSLTPTPAVSPPGSWMRLGTGPGSTGAGSRGGGTPTALSQPRRATGTPTSTSASTPQGGLLTGSGRGSAAAQRSGGGARSGGEAAAAATGDVPADGGGEFFFPRLSAAGSTDAAAAVAASVKALQLAAFCGTLPAASGVVEEEECHEISLAGGLEQLPSAARQSPRRVMSAALVSAAEALAAAAALQPRYSVWSLADYLTAANDMQQQQPQYPAEQQLLQGGAAAAAGVEVEVEVEVSEPPPGAHQQPPQLQSEDPTPSPDRESPFLDPAHAAAAATAIAAPGAAAAIGAEECKEAAAGPGGGGAGSGSGGSKLLDEASDALAALQSLIRQVAYL